MRFLLLALSLQGWPLQLQCGVQATGSSFLAYGQLVFQSAEGLTYLTHFEQRGPESSPHPFCARIRQAMEAQRPLQLELASDGKLIKLGPLNVGD